MPKPHNRETRLAEALRANLRRRKGARPESRESGQATEEEKDAAVPDVHETPRPNPAPKRT